MIQDAETEGNLKISVEHDQIVIKRLINKEKPDQGALCETITVGTTITCQTCFGTEIEGEVLAFNAHTRTVIIKPAPISDKPMRTGMHMVNLDYVKYIRIRRVCTNKPPEHTTINMKRVHTSMKEGVEKNKLVMTVEARDIPTNEVMFKEKEHWSWDDADAPVKVNGSTNTENNARFHSKWQQTHNRMSAMPKSTHGGNVKNKLYEEQNHGYVAYHTTKTMKEGEIAPMVPSDSKRQRTQHNVLAMNENIDRKEEMNKIYQKHKMSAMYEVILQEDIDAKTYMKSGNVPGAVATISSCNDGQGDPQQSCKTGTEEDMERPTVTSERGRGGHN
jgi:hypothetical protein